jgi:hypothetical protein
VRIGVLDAAKQADKAAIGEALLKLSVIGYGCLRDKHLAARADPSPQHGQGHAVCG